METTDTTVPGPETIGHHAPDVAVDNYAWVILLVAFLASVAAPLNQFKVPPLMPVLMEAFQLSLGQAGMLMSIFALTGLILALPAGIIMQKLGPKVAGLIAVGSLAVGSLLGVVSSTAGLMLFSRVIEGIGMGLIAVVAPATITMWFPREKQGVPLGLWATWVPVGSLIMYNLAPWLATTFGWQAVWWFGAGFAVITFVLYGLLMRTPPTASSPRQSGAAAPTPPKLSEGLANRDIWLLAVHFSCFAGAFLAFGTFFPTFLATERGYDLGQAAFIASLSTMVILFSAPLAGWVSDQIGSRKLVYTVPFILTALMFLLPFRLFGWQIYVFLIVQGLMVGAIPTATFAAVPEVMNKPQLAGIGMAILMTGQNLGMFVGPAVFGGLIESIGWVTAGILLIPVCAVGIIAGWLVRVR
jgi:nitrate/nitrite transporter NarK